MKRKAYEAEWRKLQGKLCHLQEWVKQKGLRVILRSKGVTPPLLAACNIIGRELRDVERQAEEAQGS